MRNLNKTNMKKFTRIIAFFFVAMVNFVCIATAQTIVKGLVRDAQTGQPLQGVGVYFLDGKGTVTDSLGQFYLASPNNYRQLVFSSLNFKKKTVFIKPGQSQQYDAALESSDNNMNEVVVTARKKIKYTNKNNPAVELIRKVIEHRDENRMSSYQSVHYEQYEKMTASLSSRNGEIPGRKLLKKFDFVLDNIDTTTAAGKVLLPFYVEETVSDKYTQKDPDKSKVRILGSKKVSFGEAIDANGISKYLNYLYQDVDVYQNNVTIMTNQFLSPIANIAPTFYMFFIRDTVTDAHGTKLVRLSFYPRNTNDMLFRGTIFVTLDGKYGVQKLEMSINPNINLNFVKELFIKQQFARNNEGRYYLVQSGIRADFGITKGSSKGIFAERMVAMNDFTFNQPFPDSVFRTTAMEKLEKENEFVQNDAFWAVHRQVPLSVTEAKTYTNIDSLTHMKSYKNIMDWATVLLAGYKSAGPAYEIGPINTFYSFSDVEGLRLRIGGRTTPAFSKRFYLENYFAYGFRDKREKYFASVAYSINNKSVYKFPYNYIKASYTHDMAIPGLENQFVNEDNFLLSFKRGTNDKWVYNNIARVEFVREFANNMSFSIGYKYQDRNPAGVITYTKPGVDGKDDVIRSLKTSSVTGQFRWAPHEAYYQGKVYRTPIINKYPIFTLNTEFGLKNVFKGQYNFQRVSLNIFKRFYLSQFGFSDVVADAGYTFGQVPFPLMTIHRANQTFAYQIYSYNMMNFMEFASDHYASINIDHHFNGLLFNRVPLLQKLKWREIVAVKALWGGIRKENDPALTKDVYKFPVNASGEQITYALGSTPYVEGSVGIGNIFKFIRLDYVRRFTYLQNTDVSKWGIRALIRFDF
jgi:hypothetical protein